MKKYFGIGIYVFLFAIATLFDLEISTYVTSVHLDWYVTFGARFGAATAPLAAAFCLMGLAKIKGKRRDWILAGILLLVAGYLSVRPAWNPYSILLCLLCSCGYALVLYFLAKYLGFETEQETDLTNGIWFIVCSTIAVNVLKCIWARPRFYSFENPVQEFLPWYIPQPFVWTNDALKSFPSGHTTSASSALLLIEFSTIYHANRKQKMILGVIAILWIVVTASSRVFGGYHFLSDTLAGFGITYLLYEWIVVRRRKALQQGKKQETQ